MQYPRLHSESLSRHANIVMGSPTSAQRDLQLP
jgi:hypothetical protein